jgi:hypothetical protein
MADKYGIENLKTLLAFIFLGFDQLFTIDKNQDGKVSWSEGLSTFTTLSFRFPSLYDTFPFLKKEWKDLDQAEKDELIRIVNEDLDLPMKFDNIEKALKISINALSYNFRIFKDLKALFPKKTPSLLSKNPI